MSLPRFNIVQATALIAAFLCCFPFATNTFAGPADSGNHETAVNSLKDDILVKIQFDQKLNSQVSPQLTFLDETGKPVRLKDYFGKRPIIVAAGYNECPMLCTLVLNGLIESLHDLKLTAGSDFDVVFLSIDPREKPALAAAKKRTYMRRYGRPGADIGWHFLTGGEADIKDLTSEIGFRYAYDEKLSQYAHPSGLVILTPQGRVAHYMFGVTYSPKELDQDLRDAGNEKTGSPVEQFILLCFHYSPIKGKYGKLIMDIVRGSGIVTMVGLAGLILMIRKRKHGFERLGATSNLPQRPAEVTNSIPSRREVKG